jgi:hypothetical protein
MHTTVFILALVAFHEDRTGSLTDQWAIMQATIQRTEDPQRFADSLIEVVEQPGQYSWAYKLWICDPSWNAADLGAWQIALSRAQLVWLGRDRVSHPYMCFYSNTIHYKYFIAHAYMRRVYGKHTFWKCN